MVAFSGIGRDFSDFKLMPVEDPDEAPLLAPGPPHAKAIRIMTAVGKMERRNSRFFR